MEHFYGFGRTVYPSRINDTATGDATETIGQTLAIRSPIGGHSSRERLVMEVV